MGAPYSLDLRERVVAAVEVGGMSRRRAAEHFGVAISTAINWVKAFRQTGSLAPGQMGGHRPKKIAGPHRVWLTARCQSADFTLRGLVAEFGERGLQVDYRSVWEFVHAEKLSFKKNTTRQRAGSPRCRAPTRTMEAVSGTDRSGAPRIHR